MNQAFVPCPLTHKDWKGHQPGTRKGYFDQFFAIVPSCSFYSFSYRLRRRGARADDFRHARDSAGGSFARGPTAAIATALPKFRAQHPADSLFSFATRAKVRASH